MQVVLLEEMHYPTDGSHGQSVQTPNPSRQTIKAAIHRLDRDEWPYLWLHVTQPVKGQIPENGLCIMGGRGEDILHDAKSYELRANGTIVGPR
jgi:hypothetical protein